ncbi:Gfo/Idh/MocA family protein [Microlunatus soli]|uniref:Predicted dehydrogenase n=1 Tax=Microlunatus soli TaxID=630515 RepID=A0A1H2A8P4_9ACTN|nr:Gfo/Idh/MocA family oxidoreductase [Microlunatus soli]SDT42355.1 Predicted dehydrogenase [Microlunatus soli]
MIRVGLIGAVDQRHRWFLAAAQRRRAGVRIVGLSEPDPAARRRTAELYDLPSWSDHRDLLDAAAPSLVAIAGPGSGPIVIDALQHNVDVLVAPPLCDSLEELDTIARLAADLGHRVSTSYTYRGHPAAGTAVELLGRIGRPQLVSLLLGGEHDGTASRLSIMEAFDLFGRLTGGRPAGLTTVTDGHPAAVDDPAEIRAAYGELILVGSATNDRDGSPSDAVGAEAVADEATFEVRRRPGAVPSEVIEISGPAGMIEWEVGSGRLRSILDGQDPVTLSCGPATEAEWVLNNLIRRREPMIDTEHSLALSRLLLAAGL